MSITKVPLILLLAVFFNAAVVSANDTFAESRVRDVPSGLTGSLSLNGSIDVALVDRESASLQDMLDHPSLFSPIAGHDINLGFVQTSAWMRFALALSPQARDPQKLLLSITPNFTDELEIYVSRQKGSMSASDFDRYEMGDHSPRSQAHFNTSANVLPLELWPGQTAVIYLRARNLDASLNVSVELLSPSEYEFRSITQNLVRGMWFGGMAILFVIQFFFFYFDRKKFYIALALDILAVGSTYFGSLGLARLLLFSEGGPGNDYLTSSSSWFGLAAGALSIAGILDLRQRYPRLELFCRVSTTAGLIGVLCVFAGVNRYFVTVAGPIILILTTLAMVVAFVDFNRSRDAQHGLNFAAFSLLWAGLMVTNSQRYGLLPLPGWVASSYAATSIVHFTLLTGSLAVRLRKAEVALQAELHAQEQQVQFMEVISHQYRTPLGVIRTNLDSVRLTLPQSDVSNRERLNRANGGIKRLVEVLEVNLSRSKIQGPSYRPSFLDTIVTELTEVAVSHAGDLLPGATINLAVSAEAITARVRADREMLRLAIINLLENAAKFSAPLGSTTVELNVFCVGQEVFLQITDNGIGIGNDQANDLVEHSMRGANTVHVEGRGIGLSLVKRTVDAHGGHFLLRNRSNGGAEATIALPLLEQLQD
ncbi:sensor histidine kinase [Agrobacterium genomosp. 13]|uniref:histidine kinase n=1 Tax=Agrobacterium genomosp. 13 str. CFBP 6927 TaxID=1183428 RepID=A0ABM9VJ29_9HYPH|nr:ATP-binding protein [Agrobacterium genomosp. 13]CUX47331.1 putative Histidine kinase [Agrobacterium genomosp. 13 str. CFBP 6927]